MECFRKQQRLDRLEEENRRLKEKLRYEEKKAHDGFFGASTPSSKLPVKANTEVPLEKKPRGGRIGHEGYGRSGGDVESADRVIQIPPETGGVCPSCGGKLHLKQARQRRVRECRPVEAEDLTLQIPIEECASCHKRYSPKPKEVLPKAMLGNQLVANAIEMTYLHGIPLGRVCEQLKVNPSTLLGMYHQVATLISEVPKQLSAVYRQSPVKHADETGWRTEGKNGYAWLFATEKMSLFQFEKTRSASIPKAVFGSDKVPGVLVVDRYAGYNKMPCEIQYCYAHLLREVQEMEKEFPEVPEVKTFVGRVAPLLATAIGLRSQHLSDEAFLQKAKEVKAEIQQAMEAPAHSMAIRHIQGIFRENEARLYHWARDRNIPADNNLSERDLRPTVIARKTSFGSQSEAGAKTRGTLMSVVHTLKKQRAAVAASLKAALDAFVQNPGQDFFAFLFPSLASPT
jgi:ssDNA-binding Zn-finger/Zn-ribbon topoisomerase 1